MVLGSGGREHALCYRLSKSPSVSHVYCAPGTYGMSDVAQPVSIDIMNNETIIKAAKYLDIDLVLVGPETILENGVTDALTRAGIKVFGPSKEATKLESSKSYSKDFMKKHQIPTANYETFTDYESAKAYLEKCDFPQVIKASGLAAGKGVTIPETLEEALKDAHEMLVDKRFGDSSSEIIIEDFMQGEEFSLLVLCHHNTALPLQVSQDYKRIYDGDKGENTGGMGAYTPVDHITKEDLEESMKNVVYPTLQGMMDQDTPFVGVLFAGLMKTDQGIKVIEYNVRFGDPETEALMLAFESDLNEIILSVMNDDPKEIEWSKDYHMGVVMSAKNYPNNPETGALIDKIPSNVFHMGTHYKDDQYFVSGGRVLFVHGSGSTLEEARTAAYKNIGQIECEGIHYRKDIGKV